MKAKKSNFSSGFFYITFFVLGTAAWDLLLDHKPLHHAILRTAFVLPVAYCVLWVVSYFRTKAKSS